MGEGIFSNILSCRKLIRDMAPIIDPEEDYLTILAAEEQIAAAEARRKKELEGTHSRLKSASNISLSQ